MPHNLPGSIEASGKVAQSETSCGGGGAMLRLGGVASRTYLVAFPAIKQHFQQQGIELDWVLYSSWDALVEAFVRREVDVAWNGPLAYVKIKRRLGDPCQVVAMRDIDVNLVTAFITQPQSAIRTVDDLKGTRFAFGARGSVEAGLLAYHFLKQGGIEPSQDLALATFCEERPTPNADSQRLSGNKAFARQHLMLGPW